MRVVGAWSMGAVVWLGLAMACSSGTKSGSPAAGGATSQSGAGGGGAQQAGAASQAGTQSGGGSSSGGGGSSSGAGGGASVATPYEACVAYLKEQCNRVLQVCGGREPLEDPCPSAAEWCPDFLFADGSGFDVQSAMACAETFKTFDCDKLNRGIYPDCVRLPGTRALGQPCKYSHQCESSTCGRGMDTAHAGCGQCVTIGKLGDDCDAGATVCPDGTECTGGTCQTQLIFNLPDGAPCERYGQCAGIDYCFPTLQGEMRCQAPLALGAPCVPQSLCNGGTCTEGVCAPFVFDYAAVGASCLDKLCAPGGWCRNSGEMSALCVAQASVGEVCERDPRLSAETQGNCATKELQCRCQGDGCVPHCLRVARVNEACSDPLVFCVLGTRCDAGKCVGVESQGLFEEACGM